ncbi:hypothetical protein ACFVH6_23255 [Spirillospora sp. NPDC127200]
MRRNTILAASTALACGAGLVLTAAPAHAAAWRNIASPALKYNGSLERVDFADKNNGWAVGNAGNFLQPQAKLVRWNGKAWVGQSSPVGFAPTDVAAGNAKRAWVVGFNLSGPVSIYWNGSKWAKAAYPKVGMPSQVSAALDGTAYSVAGLDATAGGPSAVLRWTGSAWADAKVPLPPSSSITAVDVRAKNNVWLAGTTSNGRAVTGIVLHYNGSAWKRINVPGAMGAPAYQGVLSRIAVSGNNVYVLRAAQYAQITNALLQWNGKTWRTLNNPGNAIGTGLSADGRGGAVVLPVTNGDKARYLHFNGTSWASVHGPARSGKVQAGDADHRPGTTGIVSAGTAAASNKKVPFIEYFG